MEFDYETWMGIYKGLRLPLLGMILIFIAYYVYRPSKKAELEQPRFRMLDDDVDQGLAEKFESRERPVRPVPPAKMK